MKAAAVLLFICILGALALPAPAVDTLAVPVFFEGFEGFTDRGNCDSAADGWSTFVLGDPDGWLKFFKDPGPVNYNHATDPLTPNCPGPQSTASQGITAGRYLGRYSGGIGAAGIYNTVGGLRPTSKGYPFSTYLYCGYVDIWQARIGEAASQPIANAYHPLFGINTKGEVPSDFGSPNVWPGPTTKLPNAGGANWALPGAAVHYDAASTGMWSTAGFFTEAAAWPIESSTATIWNGVTVRSTGSGNPGTWSAPSAESPVWDCDHFEIDSHGLYEFPMLTTRPLNTCFNGDFEGDTTTLNMGTATDTPGWKFPKGWIPIGGGLGRGHYFRWDVSSTRSGGNGNNLVLQNRNGQGFFGVMQQVEFVGDPLTLNVYEFVLQAQGMVLDTGQPFSRAMIGIDPTGGLDPTNPNVVWTETQQQTVLAPMQVRGIHPVSNHQVITLYLMSRSIDLASGEPLGIGWSTGYSGACFDNVQFCVIGGCTEPPLPFDINILSGHDQTSYLKFALSARPSAPCSPMILQKYALGTTPGGTEVSGWKDADPYQQFFEVYDLDMPAGSDIFVTVKQTNASYQTAEKTSRPFRISPAPNPYTFWNKPEELGGSIYSTDSPQILCGDGDRVYLAYRSSDGNYSTNVPQWAGTEGQVFFRKKDSRNWSDPEVVYTNPFSGREWDPYLVIDSSGLLHCLFQTGGTYNSNEIWHCAFKYGGIWLPDNRPGGTFGWFNRAVAGPNGQIIMAGNRTSGAGETGTETCTYQPVVMTWNGTAWSEENVPGASSSNEVARATPSVAVDQSGGIHLLWMEKDMSGQRSLLYQKKQGTIWGAPVVIRNSTTDSPVPESSSGSGDYSIAIDGSGKVHVVYVANHLSSTGQVSDVWYTSSIDGLTWSPAKYVAGGCWPTIKVRGAKVHMVSYISTQAATSTHPPMYRPLHRMIDAGTGTLSNPVFIADQAYTSQPYWMGPDGSAKGSFRFNRSDYLWGWVRKSHLAPGSFDVDEGGNIHFAWSSSSRAYDSWQIDYYSTTEAPNVPPEGGIGGAKRRPGPLPWPVELTGKLVVAEGSIHLGVWKVPYVYIQEDDRSAGIRVLVPTNIDLVNPEVEVNAIDDIRVGDRIDVLSDPDPQKSSQITLDTSNNPLFGELQIGRVAGPYLIRNVSVRKVSEKNALPRPLYLKRMVPASEIVICAQAGSLWVPRVPDNTVGLDFTGLYATIVGKVVHCEPAGDEFFFYLEEPWYTLGQYSSLFGDRIPGAKVYTSTPPTVGSFYAVRGMVSCERALADDPDGKPDSGDEVYDLIRVIRPAKDDPEHVQKIKDRTED